MERVRRCIQIDAAIAQGLTGKNIGVGVLDSGVNPHKELVGKVVAYKNFVDRNVRRPNDETGHGTHVCGIIAAEGNGKNGKYRGIAPGCHLCVGKILNRRGEGDIITLIQGIEWLLCIAKEKNIKVINISVSSLTIQDAKEKKKLYQLFEEAYNKNILLVTAAGNSGPSNRTLSKLGDSPYVICVGCHEGKESKLFKKKCQDCSGRGPGSYVYKKPDIVAPGTEIVSCGNMFENYISKSGTSMATPIISGVLALAYEKYPYLSAEEMKRRLMHATDDLGESYLLQGFGMVNVQKLLK